MRTRKYSCPNGCKLPARRKRLMEIEKHTYGFTYDDFSYCPICGALMPYTKKTVGVFFEIYQVHPRLEKSKQLFLKSEYNSAAREAFVVVESELRKKSGLDSHGSDLANKALKFEVDKTGVLLNNECHFTPKPGFCTS